MVVLAKFVWKEYPKCIFLSDGFESFEQKDLGLMKMCCIWLFVVVLSISSVYVKVNNQ